MATETISFRVNTETYLKLEALASEKGTSIGLYVKNKLEDEMHQLGSDIRLMQVDLAEVLHEIRELKDGKIADNLEPNTEVQDDKTTAAIIETLLILREIAQPSKLSAAQKKVAALGISNFKTWER